MKNDVKLFINNELVDFSNELSMPFVYQLEDTNNPSIVKNSFTKTITIVGTKQNNKIFGDIYNFDREQLYDVEYVTGAYFNPSFRTPFSIYNNGELIESGYMQLNSITIKDKLINYQITLYGGLGDFFYNLSYNKDSERITLGDLTYGVKDDEGKTIDSEKEFDFNISKEVVRDCWFKTKGNGTFEDYITFVPCYNGVYEDFDNKKALINTTGSQIFTQSSLTQDNKMYVTINGYALAEWENELTEWEMRDLRSYQQRPAIKLSKVIEACCDPINNGGYKVDLDPTFFNENNPYWDKAYIALPMFGSLLSDESGALMSDGSTSVLYGDYSFIGTSGSTTNAAIGYYIRPKGEKWIVDDYSFVDMNDFNFSTVYSADIDIQLFFKGNTTQDLYLSYLLNGKVGNIGYTNHPMYQSIIAQIAVYTEDSLFPIAYSNIYNFTNKLPNGKYSTLGNSNTANISNSPYTDVFGRFVYDSNSGLHYFKSDAGNNTFRLNLKNIPRGKKMLFTLMIQRIGNYNTEKTYMTTAESIAAQNVSNKKVNGYWTASVAPESTISAAWESGSIGSGKKITKQLLLKTENTPSDYLLSYAKLFNLHFKKSVGDKRISILTRGNYFMDEVEDWSKRIDWSQDVKIDPIVFDKKFYAMKLKGQNDNYYLKKYKNDYSIDYGQKRINTAYNFNAETQELFNDNVYENGICVLDNSVYYRSFYNADDKPVPAFAVEGLKYNLFWRENGEYNSAGVEMNDLADVSKTVKWYGNSGYDAIAKPSFFKMDNNKKTLSDINNTLLFFVGNKTPKDINDNAIKYWLSDDLEEMGTLNDGKPCFLYTESEFDFWGERIAYNLTSIPQFLRYNIENNTVLNSWDFAVPKESYIPNLNYDESTTIYNRFWSDFYEDQLNINTKKITCNVNLQGLVVNDELLRKFYWFGNSLWILNKIQDYDINSSKTTKCEFIKVQEQFSYLKPIGF